jgi:hypothetical protein
MLEIALHQKSLAEGRSGMMGRELAALDIRDLAAVG